jgi:hypothetical protein
MQESIYQLFIVKHHKVAWTHFLPEVPTHQSEVFEGFFSTIVRLERSALSSREREVFNFDARAREVLHARASEVTDFPWDSTENIIQRIHSTVLLELT